MSSFVSKRVESERGSAEPGELVRRGSGVAREPHFSIGKDDEFFRFALSLRRNTTVDDCRLVDLPVMTSDEGNLTPVYPGEHVPFEIARVYYLYDVPGGASRGGHAHKQLQQLIVAAMGAFNVIVDDGRRRKTIRLERAFYGLYIPRMIWREIVDFSSGGICLSLASLPYDENEYIRDPVEFRRTKSEERA